MPQIVGTSRLALTLRALAVWLLLAGAEIVHGVARRLLLEPLVGDFRARQIAVFTGSAIVLLIAYACSPWIGARTRRQRLGVGALWLTLMLAFELAAGRFLAHYSWQRIASDYDLAHGGLLPIGMAVLFLAPLLAARRRQPGSSHLRGSRV